jgi:ABC-type sugar transport system permease subunit
MSSTVGTAPPQAGAPTVRHPPARRRRVAGRSWEPLLWIAPALLVVGLIFVYGLISLINTSLRSGGRFVGFHNLSLVLQDPLFRTALGHNARLLLAVPILMALSVLIAILLFEGVRGWRFHRAVVFMPYVLPIPVVAVVFGMLLTLNGPVNTALHTFGLGALAHDWFGQPRWALWTLTGVIIWKELGFGVVLVLARLMSLPSEVFEAARLDGARFWRLHTLITVPQLRGVLSFYAVTEAITMVSWVFNYVYVVSNGTGGPGDATQVAELYIYQTAFQFNARELASAAALLLFAVTFVLIVVYFRLAQRRRPDVARA